jgi:dihydrodipicolinate synthase/N-acetylneuraminate lyase
MGGQTTSTQELQRLVRAAERLGADYVQVSPPFYFDTTEDDFYEHVVAGADAGAVGLILYNTFWTSLGMSSKMVERVAEIPYVVGLKWATPDTGFMAFEQVVTRFKDRFSIIDNQMRYVISHMLGARSIEIHQGNYWPQFAAGMWAMLERGDYVTAQHELVRVAMPYMMLWGEMEAFTSGDGYLDKLCMELVGLPSSRSRPPTRDVRPLFRERCRQMLLDTGVPNVAGAPAAAGVA